MARQQKRFWVNKKKGVVIGRFHALVDEKYGKNPPMFELCSAHEAEFKQLEGTEVKRTEVEYASFLQKKYEHKLAELSSNVRYRRSLQRRQIVNRTIGQVMGIWLEEVEKFSSPLTLKEYRKLTRTYLESIGDHAFTLFDRNYENEFREQLLNLGLGRNTCRKYISHLQTFLYWANDNDLLEKRIKLKKPEKLKKEHLVYRKEDLRRLLDQLQADWEAETHPKRKQNRLNHLRLFHMAITTGMRGGEIKHLRLDQIDLSRELIYICAVDVMSGDQRVRWEPKGKKEGTVPISRDLRRFLEKDLETREPQEVWFLDNGEGGMAYTGNSSISAPFRKLKKRLGLRDVKPVHGFRSTVITELLNQGKPIPKVQKLARHSDIQTTTSYYNSEDAHLQELVDSIPTF